MAATPGPVGYCPIISQKGAVGVNILLSPGNLFTLFSPTHREQRVNRTDSTDSNCRGWNWSCVADATTLTMYSRNRGTVHQLSPYTSPVFSVLVQK